MEVRYSTHPDDFRTMAQGEIRKRFLIDSLFSPDAVPMVYSDIDRSIIGSAVPVRQRLRLLSSKKEMAADYFTERREVGVIDIGGKGTVTTDGIEHHLAGKDGLYIGRGAREISFASDDPSNPAAFYFVSYPAHQMLPTTLVRFTNTEPSYPGSNEQANKRTIHKYIHPNGVKSCQLVMGMTELAEGSVWNTMPPHTHQRRSEIYMYCNLPQSALAFHIMGLPHETKHIIVRDRQAVVSPSWSIHAGVGTQAYSFVWAMGGENQAFDDMDDVTMDSMM